MTRLLIYSSLALTTGLASPAWAETQPLEFKFAPGIGYSSYQGVLVAADMSLALTMSDRWQWEFGADGVASSRNGRANSINFYSGPKFNFSDDRARSFFVATGIGFGDRDRSSWDREDLSKRAFGYVELGKRFKMNDSGTWTYSPSVRASSYGFNEAPVVTILPLTFTYSF